VDECVTRWHKAATVPLAQQPLWAHRGYRELCDASVSLMRKREMLHGGLRSRLALRLHEIVTLPAVLLGLVLDYCSDLDDPVTADLVPGHARDGSGKEAFVKWVAATDPLGERHLALPGRVVGTIFWFDVGRSFVDYFAWVVRLSENDRRRNPSHDWSHYDLADRLIGPSLDLDCVGCDVVLVPDGDEPDFSDPLVFPFFQYQRESYCDYWRADAIEIT